MNRILLDILSSVWLIDKERSGVYATILYSLLKGEAVTMEDSAVARELARSFVISASSREERLGLKSDQIPGGSIAVIPIRSEIMKYDVPCGARGSMSIISDIKAADENSNISSILLVIDSPGGQVSGTDLLVEAIKGASKPIVAFVEGVAASAAYWIASAADKIIASSTLDRVGSIGTMLFFADLKPYYEKEGVKFHEFYATASVDKNKEFNQILDGNYEPYQKSALDKINTKFMTDVKANRPGLDESTLTGKMYFAEEAISLGLIDDIGSIEFAIQSCTELSQSIHETSLNTEPMKMKAGWKAILSLFSIGEEQVDAEEMTVERMGELNTELETLRLRNEDLSAQLLSEQQASATLRDNLAAERLAHSNTTTELESLRSEDGGSETVAAKHKDKIEQAAAQPVYAHDQLAAEFLGED